MAFRGQSKKSSVPMAALAKDGHPIQQLEIHQD